jgi:pimeloyl-ACP methyl ester carboxylesterase
MIARPDSRPLLVDISVPTLVLVGRQDLATPLAAAEEMAADIAHSRWW